jgi:hypothetical protein
MFPGAILATTNCVLEPPKSYKDRLFTTNEAGLTGGAGNGVHMWGGHQPADDEGQAKRGQCRS